MAPKNESLLKFCGAIAPLFVSCILLAAQWGSVTNKLENFEDRLNNIVDYQDKKDERMTRTMEKTIDALSGLKSDLSFVKGNMKKDVE